MDNLQKDKQLVDGLLEVVHEESLLPEIPNMDKNYDELELEKLLTLRMEHLRAWIKDIDEHMINNKTSTQALKKGWEKITMLLLPLTPHLAHEIMEKINKNFYWPEYNLKLLEEKECKIVIQVDGKKRGILEVSINTEKEKIIEKAKKIENVLKYLKNSKIIKNIYIENKLINFIIGK